MECWYINTFPKLLLKVIVSPVFKIRTGAILNRFIFQGERWIPKS